MNPTPTTGGGAGGPQPNFSNIQTAPTVAQPANASPNRVMFNKKYLLSVPGLLRLGLIIFQFCAWVSAAAVLNPAYPLSALPGDFAATRGAYLFFSVVGFLIAILIFVVHVFNFVNVKLLNRVPWTLISMATDFLWLIPTFVLAIVAAVKEGQSRDPSFSASGAYNFGSFASAAFWGFLCTIIYSIDGGLHLMQILRNGPAAPPLYSP